MKKYIVGVFVALLASFSVLATESFTKAKFDRLQAEQAVVLVDVKASWCPTCAKQAKILKAYLKAHPESQLTVLTVDFDKQKRWVRHFKAPRQSTLLLFKGEERVWFSVAETRKKVIFEQLKKAEAL